MKKLYLFPFFLIFICKIFANPDGGKVIHGEVDIAKIEKDLLHINQNSDKAIINWDNFSIKRGEKTEIFQPSKTSILLNRVVGNLPSEINGILNANGIVYLVNDKGIMIGKEGTIRSSGFIASTLKMTDESFLKGRKEFSSNGFSKFENKGTIESTYGDIYIVAPEINNQGKVVSNARAIFASADEVLFISKENGLAVKTKGKGYISQEGIIEAKKIELRAESGDLSSLAINLKGNIRATSLKEENGEIYLIADSGIVEVRGNIEAKKEDGKKGGTIHILADNIGIFEESHIDATGVNGGGEILIGGDYQGKNPLIKNAKNVYVDEKVFIDASAIESGNGGKIILWGDDGMFYRGTIKAEGGKEIGDGGFVEISSHGFWHAPGKVTTKAYNGDMGQLLYDPVDLTITPGGGDVNCAYNPPPPQPGTYTFTGTPAQIDATLLGINLNNNDVTIDVVNPSLGGSGLVDILGPINWSAQTNFSISAKSIYIYPGALINNSNTTAGYWTAVAFTANGLVSGLEDGITVDSTSISTLVGNIVLNGRGNKSSASPTPTYYGIKILSSNITTEDGHISLTGLGGGDPFVGDNVHGIYIALSTIAAINGSNTGIGSISLYGTSRVCDNNNVGVYLDTGTQLEVDTNNLYISGEGRGQKDGNVGVYLDNANIFSNSGGNITIIGQGGLATDTAVPFAHSDNDGIKIYQSQIDSIGDGGIYLTGYGHGGYYGTAGDGENNPGIEIEDSLLRSQAAGSIKLDGFGGGLDGSAVYATDRNPGVYILNNAIIHSFDGDIDIDGTSYANGRINVGAYISNGAIVKAAYLDGGKGSIHINGKAADGTEFCEGVNISLSDVTTKTTSGSGGNISITGYGGQGSSTDNYGAVIIPGATNTIYSDGSFSVTGVGGAGEAFSFGVYFRDFKDTDVIAVKDVTITGTGGSGSLDRNYGIYLLNSDIKVSDNNISLLGSTKPTLAEPSDLNHAVILSGSSITSEGLGDIHLKGVIESSVITDNNYGIYLIDSILTSSSLSAVISLEGTAAGVASDSSGNYGVYLERTILPVPPTLPLVIDGEKITIDGHGQGVNGHGIYLKQAAIQGNLELVKLSGSSKECNDSSGIYINDHSTIVTDSGSIECSGDNQGDDVNGSNHGINIYDNSYLETYSGRVSVSGMGGIGASTNSNGVNIETSSYVESSTGQVDVYGEARGTSNCSGIQVNDASAVRTLGSLGVNPEDINCTGISKALGSNNYGIAILAASRIYSDSFSKIDINGKSGNTTSASRNYGIYIDSALVTSYEDITLHSDNGVSAGDFNYAICIQDQSSINAYSTNDITIEGTNPSAHTGESNKGIYIYYSTIDATASSESKITIKGTGYGVDKYNYGIEILGQSLTEKTEIFAKGGDIKLIAEGNNGDGCRIAYTDITNESIGNIIITGNATISSGLDDFGVGISSNTEITTTSGNIEITGVAQGTYGSGVSVDGSIISCTSEGSLLIDGDSQAPIGFGVGLENCQLLTNSGLLQIKGRTSATATYKGILIDIVAPGSRLSSTSNNIEFICDSFKMNFLGDPFIDTTNEVYLLSLNSSDTMAIGYTDYAVGFHIDATSLDLLRRQNYGKLNFGNSTYGNNIIIGNGSSINLSSGDVEFSGNSITIDSPINIGVYDATFRIGNLSGPSHEFIANELISMTTGNVYVYGGQYLDYFYFYADGQVAYVDGGVGINLLEVGSDWYLTGKNKGTVDNIEFENIQYLVGGNDDDTFKFADGASVDGTIDGGVAGYNILDYSEYTSPVFVDLAAGTATGTGGILNIDGYILPKYIILDIGDNVVNLFLGLSMNNFDYFYHFSPYYIYQKIFLEDVEAKILKKDLAKK